MTVDGVGDGNCAGISIVNIIQVLGIVLLVVAAVILVTYVMDFGTLNANQRMRKVRASTACVLCAVCCVLCLAAGRLARHATLFRSVATTSNRVCAWNCAMRDWWGGRRAAAQPTSGEVRRLETNVDFTGLTNYH